MLLVFLSLKGPNQNSSEVIEQFNDIRDIHRQSRTQCGPAKILTMINIPIPKPINPREPEMILPSQVGDTLFLPSPEAASRNLLHVTALYKKAIPTKQQASPAAQIKNSVFPPAEGAPGMTTE
jgi:hypothetical protein